MPTDLDFISRGPWRRWRVYVALAVIALLLYGGDRLLKSSDQAGIHLDSWDWEIEAPDLPAAWQAWRRLAAFEAFQEKSPGTLQDIAVAVRKLTGVRPTPQRLRFWLGYSVLLGGEGEEWAMSVRPGIVLRLATCVGYQPGWPASGTGEAATKFPCGWRDGFWVVASSQPYLDRQLAEGRTVPRTNGDSQILKVAWAGESPGTLELRLDEGLPVRLQLGNTPFPDGPALRRPNGWEDATVWMACRGGGVLQQVRGAGEKVGEALLPLAYFEAVTPILDAWWQAFALPGLVPRDEPAWLVGIFETDLRAELPSVEMAWAEFGEKDAAHRHLDGLERQPHRWDQAEGWIVPKEGDAGAWAAVDTGDGLLLASKESLLSRAFETAPEPDTAFLLHCSWKLAGSALADLARRAAEDALLPGMNRDDVDGEIVPPLEALQDWGTLQLSLRKSGSGIEGTGLLAELPPDPP